MSIRSASRSIHIGKGLNDAPPGSLRNVYLVVTDLEAARSRLLERGVQVGEIRRKMPIGAWDGGFTPGLGPARGDYASFANFSDPDGNSWVLQERGYRNRASCSLAVPRFGTKRTAQSIKSMTAPSRRSRNPAKWPKFGAVTLLYTALKLP
jgi:hypothetical protein